jgi:hypothetical protein
MPNLKLKKSLAKENYVKTLVIKGTCEVKEKVVDYEDRKFDPQLVNDLMNFIEKEISKGKYSKKDFDKSKILQDIVVSVFGNLSESELKWLENTIQHIIDNDPILKQLDKKIADMNKNATQNMVKKYPEMKQLFQKYGYNKFD